MGEIDLASSLSYMKGMILTMEHVMDETKMVHINALSIAATKRIVEEAEKSTAEIQELKKEVERYKGEIEELGKRLDQYE